MRLIVSVPEVTYLFSLDLFLSLFVYVEVLRSNQPYGVRLPNLTLFEAVNQYYPV